MGNRIRIAVAIICAVPIVALMSTPSPAQQDGSPVSIGTYRTMHSEILNEDRTLLVSLPRGYDETAIHYPVLYVLYGGQARGYFAEAVHIADRLHEAGLIPPLMIVGVKNVDRYRDTLPVNRNGEKGGAENFLKFLSDELIPFIDSSYRTKDFRILLGPQAGAAFALYALMEEPRIFRVNIITNPFWTPSVREYLLAEAGNVFSSAGSLRNFLFVTCNTNDDNETTRDDLDSLRAIVKDGETRDFTVVINPLRASEPEHLIPAPGLQEGLIAYFSDYTFPEEREIDGLQDLKHYYEVLSQTYGYDVDVPEFTLIRQGDRLEERQKPEEARRIYEYVVSHYPHDLNSYHRLAELHRRLGDYDRSIGYYTEFLERRHEPFIEHRLNSLRRYVNESAAYAVERAFRDLGTEAGIAKYRELRADDHTQLYFAESEFNVIGYDFLAGGLVDVAIEIFKMNVEMNPQSANVYDSLGEAYMVSGNKALAIENYSKSLELNPDNTNASEMLEKLEGE
jgi:predicted alpha/beta superfamily hydrolase